MDKEAVIEALEEVATLLELAGDNPFKIRAFQAGARTLSTWGGSLEEGVASGSLKALPGIGKGLFEEIARTVRDGRMETLEALRAATPEGVRELLTIPGLGPKKIRALREGLEIASVGELEYAIQESRLLELPGFGKATQAKLAAAVAAWKQNRGKRLLADILPGASEVVGRLAARHPGARCSLVGPLRRACETVDSVEVLVAGVDEVALREAFSAERALRSAEDGGFTLDGLPVRVATATEDTWGSRLVWTTATEAWRDAACSQAAARGLTWNAEGMVRNGQVLATRTEAEVFAHLGWAIQAPERFEEPTMVAGPSAEELLTEGQVLGAFHVHTTDSDGTASLRDMVLRARALGWRYIGISDHSEAAFYARGLSRERIRAQRTEIAQLNEEFADITIFSGIEADILADGSLDYDDETLMGFDFVIGSIHSRFGHDAETMTRRLIRALANPRLTMLGHLTGRLLLDREPYAFDLDAVLEAAATHGKAIELNANPHRLDLDWRHLARARDLGVSIVINPDAHSLKGLEDVRWGVAMARKGGLRPADVWNTLPAEAVRAKLRREAS